MRPAQTRPRRAPLRTDLGGCPRGRSWHRGAVQATPQTRRGRPRLCHVQGSRLGARPFHLSRGRPPARPCWRLPPAAGWCGAVLTCVGHLRGRPGLPRSAPRGRVVESQAWAHTRGPRRLSLCHGAPDGSRRQTPAWPVSTVPGAEGSGLQRLDWASLSKVSGSQMPPACPASVSAQRRPACGLPGGGRVRRAGRGCGDVWPRQELTRPRPCRLSWHHDVCTALLHGRQARCRGPSCDTARAPPWREP